MQCKVTKPTITVLILQITPLQTCSYPCAVSIQSAPAVFTHGVTRGRPKFIGKVCEETAGPFEFSFRSDNFKTYMRVRAEVYIGGGGGGGGGVGGGGPRGGKGGGG